MINPPSAIPTLPKLPGIVLKRLELLSTLETLIKKHSNK